MEIVNHAMKIVQVGISVLISTNSFFLLGNRIYICGHEGQFGTEARECYKLDMENPVEWVPISPMNSARFGFGFVTDGQLLYAIGGEEIFSTRDDIEVPHPSIEDLFSND